MKTPFTRLHLDITGRCNLRCVHCFAADRYEEHLSTDDLMWLMDQVKKLDITRAAISGGEPFLREDLFEVLAEAPDDISILTNATLIEDDHIEKLLDLDEKGKSIDIRVSIDGIRSYKDVRGVDPKLALGNIEKLLERNFPVVINTTMMPFQKKEEMIELYELLLEMGVDQWSLDIPFLAGSAAKNDLRTDLKEYADTVAEIARRYTRERPTMNFDSVGIFCSAQLDPSFEPDILTNRDNPCNYQLGSVIVDASGAIKVCPSMSYSVGNISDFENLADFRESPKWKEYTAISISDLDTCPTCTYRAICGGGCRANVEHEDMMNTDRISCYLMERFEKDILPLLPEEVRVRYSDNID